MRVLHWDTAFFREFGVEKAIHKNHTIDKQHMFKPALHSVIYTYFKFILFSAKAISRTPPFFGNYLENRSPDFMLTEGIMKALDKVHWEWCRWCLDCPLQKPPSFDIFLRDSLEPKLIGIGTPKVKPNVCPADAPIDATSSMPKN